MGDLQSQTLLALAVSKLFHSTYGIAECNNIQEFIAEIFYGRISERVLKRQVTVLLLKFPYGFNFRSHEFVSWLQLSK